MNEITTDNGRGKAAKYPTLTPDGVTIAHGTNDRGEDCLIFAVEWRGQKLGFVFDKKTAGDILTCLQRILPHVEHGIREVN